MWHLGNSTLLISSTRGGPLVIASWFYWDCDVIIHQNRNSRPKIRHFPVVAGLKSQSRNLFKQWVKGKNEIYERFCDS